MSLQNKGPWAFSGSRSFSDSRPYARQGWAPPTPPYSPFLLQTLFPPLPGLPTCLMWQPITPGPFTLTPPHSPNCRPRVFHQQAHLLPTPFSTPPKAKPRPTHGSFFCPRPHPLDFSPRGRGPGALLAPSRPL